MATPNANAQMVADDLDSRITALDIQIAKLRDQKKALAEQRNAVLAEIEIMAKLGNLSDEQRQRIVLKPNPVNGISAAAK